MKAKIGIVGIGNTAHALASYLGSRGYKPVMLVRNGLRADLLRRIGTITATGALDGEFEIEVTDSPKTFCELCEIIFLATTANDYTLVIDRLALRLKEKHCLFLFSSKFAGSLEVTRHLQRHGVQDVKVLETDALFACRSESLGQVQIRGIKKWTLYSAPTVELSQTQGKILESFFPGIERAQNIVQRGLTDFGALAHPLTVLVNMNDIDRKRSFLFYYEGYTSKTVALLERMEAEFGAVAAAYGTSLIPARELLDRYYGCHTGSLLEAMQSVPNYRFSHAPDKVDSRYLLEDVPCTLVPVQQLARVARVDTPMLDAVITFASTITGIDFVGTGRTLDRLGWAGLSYTDIQRALIK